MAYFGVWADDHLTADVLSTLVVVGLHVREEIVLNAGVIVLGSDLASYYDKLMAATLSKLGR